MLIRSQNGVEMINLDNLDILEITAAGHIRAMFGMKNLFIAKYTSIEQAKKVYCMIEKAYEEGINTNIVFTMPKEEDIL